MKTIKSVKDNRKVVDVKLADDKLKLFISVKPIEGAVEFTSQELLDILAPLGSKELLDLAIISDIVAGLNSGKACEDRRIAKGDPCIPGLNGKVVWLVKRLSKSAEVKTDEKGFTDFVSLNLFENVEVGQTIARVYKPKAGVEGKDALGKPIPAPPGKPAVYSLQQSVELKTGDSFDQIVAKIAGYALEESGKIAVNDTLSVSGDLGFNYGSIDFVGSVKISGDVAKGFSIKAKGPIHILGSLQGDNRISSDQEIVVGGYHFGGERSSVIGKKGYKVRGARQVTVDVDGRIEVEKEALDCRFQTREAMHAPEALIVGGEYRVVLGAEVKQLGNEMEMPTTVVLCSGAEATLEYVQLQNNIKRHEEAAHLITLHLGPFAHARPRIELLQPDHRDKMR